MVLTIWIMLVGTALLAAMPTYAHIGFLAPVGVILARLIQGFAAGGGFGAATSFLIVKNERRKGLLGSFQFASQGLATLLTAGSAALLTALLSDDQMSSLGWRLLFVFGLFIGPVCYYIRRHVEDTPVPTGSAESAGRSPILNVFREKWADC
ncbi:hypothetical protein EV191_113115 [Tamaricihabitans halophyticus]|uniref:Major facilitator superfamily (MFS) profile domain-containing protein n=1 Tax=Tamaricihabitans halophyticus TaxID=1262583 RepID=A0A4R2QEX0_9PSEU|nr:hypothetical protein [Tamaricihabitans halophyticus]TCP46838.1 hypothetical protein EV191_113115 [Tamaricihabitans halophyticus]